MIKRKILLFFLYIILTSYTFGQHSSHKEKDGLVGNVKQTSLTSEIFSENLMGWEQCGEGTITMYDVDGRRTFENSDEKLKKLGNSILIMRFTSEFNFEEKGKTVTKETKNKDGIVTEKRSFSYDEHGFCTSFTLHTLKGVTKETKYEYEYDIYGNWTTRTDYQINTKDNVLNPVARYRRIIEYYK